MSNQYELPLREGKLLSSQTRSLLVRELKNGMFSGTSRLPSELELSELLGVSRTVIRDALSDLEREGFIERVRGLGTVINREIVQLSNRFDLKFEYYDLIRNAGYEPTSGSVQIRAAQADADVSEKLQLELGAPVVFCERMMLADGKPAIYSLDYMPASIFEGVNYVDLDWTMPLFDMLERYCGLVVTTDIARLVPTNATEQIRSKMHLAPNDALLMLDEVGYSKLSRPVLRTFGYYADFLNLTLLRKLF